MLNCFIGMLQRLVGRTYFGRWLALKTCNQAMAIIRAGMNDGIVMRNNGEQWLIDIVAPSSKYFIDVGANVGNWALAYMRAGGSSVRGLLLEPSPDTLKVLYTILENAGRIPNVEISDCAASDEEGTSKFYMEAGCGETSSLIKAHSQLGACEVCVKMTTIDAEVEKRAIPFIDMMKIDAEGYDLHVIKGARHSIESGRIGVIQFEYNSPWAHAGSTLYDALEFFRQRGYSVFLLRRNGLYEFNYDLYGEFYGYANFVAIHSERIVDFRGVVVGKN